jgi:hypothetical protein
MPIDLRNFQITRGGTQNANVQVITVSAQVFDSQGGSERTGGDFNGGTKFFIFPGVMTSLTAAERIEVYEAAIMKILEIKLRPFNG